jgi:hypothetical protein
MKLSALLFLVFGLWAVSGANNVMVSHGVHPVVFGENTSLCGTCNTFISNGINQLLNAILQGGVVGGCSGLCSKAFPTQPKEQGVCKLVCDAAGEMAFVKLVQKYSGDLDPIYFCELAKLCPVHDGGSARIDSLTVHPSSGPTGTTFEIDATFTILNQTSTGELVVQITPEHGDSFGTSLLDEGYAPGQYSAKFSLDTHPSEEEAFQPGNYVVNFIGCDGECGSKLPHSAVLFQGSSNFTISN